MGKRIKKATTSTIFGSRDIGESDEFKIKIETVEPLGCNALPINDSILISNLMSTKSTIKLRTSIISPPFKLRYEFFHFESKCTEKKTLNGRYENFSKK